MTTPYTDPRHLAAAQYGDAANLDVRRALHERFSTNRYGWLRWVFDSLLAIPPTSAILEVGCGPGSLWRENAMRTLPTWAITLTDYSVGMVRAARANLDRGNTAFLFAQADAQSLPLADGAFAVVIANHMLYHVPDRDRAYREMHRVLRPGGWLFAATNGPNALAALTDRFGAAPEGDARERFGFTLDSGGAELARRFAEVRCERYPDTLVITEAEPLVAYILSAIGVRMRFATEGEAAVRAEVATYSERALARHGAIHIPKAIGMFIARRT